MSATSHFGGVGGPKRAARRQLPLGRGARLEVNQRTHIVGLGDVSATGAYLITRAPVRVGDEHVLRLYAMPGLSEIALRARVVRIVHDGQEGAHRPRGAAVHFLDVDDEARARLESYVRAGIAGKRR
jgi:Tfp pilus assembly protein PilZ